VVRLHACRYEILRIVHPPHGDKQCVADVSTIVKQKSGFETATSGAPKSPLTVLGTASYDSFQSLHGALTQTVSTTSCLVLIHCNHCCLCAYSAQEEGDPKRPSLHHEPHPFRSLVVATAGLQCVPGFPGANGPRRRRTRRSCTSNGTIDDQLECVWPKEKVSRADRRGSQVLARRMGLQGLRVHLQQSESHCLLSCLFFVPA
jgi:hypothetical protein